MPVSWIPLLLQEVRQYADKLDSLTQVGGDTSENKNAEKPTPSDFRFQGAFSQQKAMKIHWTNYPPGNDHISHLGYVKSLTQTYLGWGYVSLLQGIYAELKSPPCDPCIPVFRAFEDEVTRHVGRMHEVAIWQISQKPHQLRVAGSFVRRCGQTHVEKTEIREVCYNS